MKLTANKHYLIIVAIAAILSLGGGAIIAEDTLPGKPEASGTNILPLVRDVQSDDAAKQIAAIDRLGSMGPQAAANDSGAVEALQNLLAGPSATVQAHAAHALGQIGPPARPAAKALVLLVGSKNETVRREAVRALAKIKPDPKLVLNALAGLLEDGNPTVRTSALHAITEFGEPAVPFLIKALQNEKTGYWAMLALAELGPQAKAAVKPLAEKLSSDDPAVRREALICLGKIGPASAAAIPALEKLLDEKRGDAVLGVAFALGCIGPEAKQAADRLKPYTADPDPLTRLACAWALARTNPQNKVLMRRAIKILAESLRSKQPAVRAAAVRGLVSLRPGRAAIIPAIRDSLRGADTETMNATMEALASLGERAVPIMARVLQDKTLRAKAAKILAEMGPKARAAVPALIASLRDDDPKTRQEILFALGAVGPGAAEAVPAITQLMDDKDMDVRYSAAYALGSIGPAAKEAAGVLQENLDSPDKFLALTSAWALVRIAPDGTSAGGAAASKALPLLIEGLNNESPAVRIEAAGALALLGEKAAPALESLKKLLGNEQTRAAAQKAIDAIEQ